jgi:sugar transferase EpsL
MSKRIIDLGISGVALVVLSPVMVVISIVIRIFLGSPVLFRQLRPGLDEQCFTLVKFRTMRDATDESGTPLPDGERMAALGRFLRASSLDELPELWNVLKGEMSLVGPRPLLPEYVSRYNDHQRRRHLVKPGITGWAQIHGRNDLCWEEKFKMDVWYVDHRSTALDFQILWRTLKIVLRGMGISQKGHATMPKFTGQLPEISQ